MKKLFIIIAVILIFSAIAFGVYFAWKKSKEILEPPVIDQRLTTNDLQPTSEAGRKLKIISDQPTLAYWLATRTNADLTQINAEIYYLNFNGQILKANEEGEDEIISDRQIENIQSVEANKDGAQIIVKYAVNSNVSRFEIYDLSKKTWQLIQNISAVTFSPDGKKIAYLEHPNSALQMRPSELIIKDLTSAKPKITKILPLNQVDFDLKWILADKIILTPKPSNLISGEAWQIDLKKKTIALFAEGDGLMLNFAKDASWGLKSSSDFQKKLNLELIDANGVSKANLGFSTLPEKCLITASNLYCAISENYNTIKEPSLPDDYLKKAVYFSDALYQISINENNFLGIFNESQPAIDAFNFEISDNRLFFINRYDNKIYGLEL